MKEIRSNWDNVPASDKERQTLKFSEKEMLHLVKKWGKKSGGLYSACYFETKLKNYTSVCIFYEH